VVGGNVIGVRIVKGPDAAGDVATEGKQEFVDSSKLLGSVDVKRDGTRVEGRGRIRRVRGGIGVWTIRERLKPLHHSWIVRRVDATFLEIAKELIDPTIIMRSFGSGGQGGVISQDLP